MNFDELNKNSSRHSFLADIDTLADEAPKTNPNAWLISLADLVSLILSFFVMIYASKDLTQEKYAQVKESFTHNNTSETKYKFIEKFSLQPKIIKKAAGLNYIETLVKNSFVNDEAEKVSVTSNPSYIKIEFEQNYTSKKDFLASLDKKLSYISKIITPLTNQVEIIAVTNNLQKSAIMSELLSKKIEETGYEHKILRTLPQELFTDDIDKDSNKVKIELLINSYEAIF